jgi:glutamate synthase (NADPH/NADH) large chain
MRDAIDEVRDRVSFAIDEGARIVVISDRNSDDTFAPIPSLLLTSAVHHHLIRQKQRTKVGLIIEAGDAREVHHMALLIGYGAGAINPYLAFETIEDLVNSSVDGAAKNQEQQC